MLLRPGSLDVPSRPVLPACGEEPAGSQLLTGGSKDRVPTAVPWGTGDSCMGHWEGVSHRAGPPPQRVLGELSELWGHCQRLQTL